MKEAEKQICAELIEIYEQYPDIPETDARRVYNTYMQASAIISEDTMRAVSGLFAHAYPDANTGFTKLSFSEVKIILEYLKSVRDI